MKKVLMVSLVVLTTASTSISLGAGVARAPREVLKDYTRQARETLFGKGGSAKTAQEATLNRVKGDLIKELNLPGKEASLRMAMGGEAGRARMDNLVTIVAAKKLSESLAKTDPVEAKSIEAAANATAKLISDASLVGALKDSAINMKAEELSLVRESLGKLENLSTDILVEFSRAERDSYTQIIEKYDALVNSGTKKSAEEAFIDSIMEVKKVDRQKALETARKLRECV